MILDIYMLRLLFAPFGASLLIAVSVLLIGRTLKILASFSDGDLSLGLLSQLLVAILPYFLVLTVPIAFLFSLQSVMIRLHQESEIDALRAAGVSYLRIFRGFFSVAFVLLLLLIYTSLVWMPSGIQQFRTLFYGSDHLASVGFTAQRFSHDIDDVTLYVDGQDESGLYYGLVMEDKRSSTPVMYVAETARIDRVANGVQLILSHGVRQEGDMSNLRMLAFDRYSVLIPFTQLSSDRPMPWSSQLLEMSVSQLWQVLADKGEPGAAAEINRRLIMPTTIIVLLLFALPLSVAPKRSGKVGLYLFGIALILVVYNVQIILHQKVSAGEFAWWSMWLGQLTWGGLGGFLFYRTSQDRLPLFLTQSGEYFYLTHQRVMHWLSHRRGNA